MSSAAAARIARVEYDRALSEAGAIISTAAAAHRRAIREYHLEHGGSCRAIGKALDVPASTVSAALREGR